jgi:hypothetical protein
MLGLSKFVTHGVALTEQLYDSVLLELDRLLMAAIGALDAIAQG